MYQKKYREMDDPLRETTQRKVARRFRSLLVHRYGETGSYAEVGREFGVDKKMVWYWVKKVVLQNSLLTHRILIQHFTVIPMGETAGPLYSVTWS